MDFWVPSFPLAPRLHHTSTQANDSATDGTATQPQEASSKHKNNHGLTVFWFLNLILSFFRNIKHAFCICLANYSSWCHAHDCKMKRCRAGYALQVRYHTNFDFTRYGALWRDVWNMKVFKGGSSGKDIDVNMPYIHRPEGWPAPGCFVLRTQSSLLACSCGSPRRDRFTTTEQLQRSASCDHLFTDFWKIEDQFGN